MRLQEVKPRQVSAPDAVLFALKDDGGFTGTPGLFIRELSEHLLIDTRLLASAIDRLWRRGLIEKVYSGHNVVGICLPRHRFKKEEVKHLDQPYSM
jgi:hypothetical protein